MTITTVTLVDDAEKTVTQTTDTVLKSISTSTVWKAGSQGFNLQGLQARSLQAITDCNTAETLLNASGWDGLTANQRKLIMLGVVQALRAQARLNLNQFDSPS